MANKKVLIVASTIHNLAHLMDTNIEAELEAQGILLEITNKLAKIGATAKEIQPPNFNPEPEAAKDPTGDSFCNEVRRRIEDLYTKAGLSPLPSRAEAMLCTNEIVKEDYDSQKNDSAADTMLAMKGVERIQEKIQEGKFSPVITTKALMHSVIAALKVEEFTWESTVFTREVVETEPEGCCNCGDPNCDHEEDGASAPEDDEDDKVYEAKDLEFSLETDETGDVRANIHPKGYFHQHGVLKDNDVKIDPTLKALHGLGGLLESVYETKYINIQDAYVAMVASGMTHCEGLQKLTDQSCGQSNVFTASPPVPEEDPTVTIEVKGANGDPTLEDIHEAACEVLAAVIETEKDPVDPTITKLEQALGGKIDLGTSAHSAADKLAQALGVSTNNISLQEVVEEGTKVEEEVEQLLNEAIEETPVAESPAPVPASNIPDKACRKAITRHVRCNPGTISQILSIDYDPDLEFPAEEDDNWKRLEGTVFKCKGIPNIIAKVFDDGTSVTGVSLEKV